jgi:hypothetical protein
VLLARWIEVGELTRHVRWVWETTDPRRSGSSGDLSKLFRNEAVKQPGVLVQAAPAFTSTTLAREVVQNSWDAARELQAELGPDSPPFDIDFTFKRLTSEQRVDLDMFLGLEALALRAGSDDGRRVLGLGDTDCLTRRAESDALDVLEISESGTTGMYGRFEGADSKLYLALISIGYTKKDEGAGGSYGYGKAGLIRASAIRMVIAYTCFRERTDDPGVTRRLLGMTYWGQHEHGDESFTGFARFGDEQHDGWVLPFENDDADEIARQFGIRIRRAEVPEDLGTTFLLVDPVVEPDDVRRALERNWWPAFAEHSFTARVIAHDGAVQVPRPKKDPVLATFMQAHALARGNPDNAVPEELSKDLGHCLPGDGNLKVGRLGLVASLADWSFADDLVGYEDGDDEGNEDVRHCSLVALVRSPMMVVEYAELRTGPPYVRGCFLADDEIDDLLRQTEPKAHDAWEAHVRGEGIDARAPKVSKSVHEKIRHQVREFRKRLKPPTPRPENVHVPILQDLFRQLFEGQGTKRHPPPAAPPRPIAITMHQGVEAADGDGGIRLRATATFALSAHVTEERRTVDLKVQYRFLEDDRLGEACALTIGAPAGFVNEGNGSYSGELAHDAVTFEVMSAPYSSDWTGQLIVAGNLADASSTAERTEVEE